MLKQLGIQMSFLVPQVIVIIIIQTEVDRHPDYEVLVEKITGTLSLYVSCLFIDLCTSLSRNEMSGQSCMCA